MSVSGKINSIEYYRGVITGELDQSVQLKLEFIFSRMIFLETLFSRFYVTAIGRAVCCIILRLYLNRNYSLSKNGIKVYPKFAFFCHFSDNFLYETSYFGQ